MVAELEKDKTTRARMFAVIGHELRTPIAAMQMMLQHEFEQSPSEANESLLASTEHLLAVLDDLRAVARPDELVLRDWAPVLIGQELRALQRLLNAFGEAQGVKVDLELKMLGDLRINLPLHSFRQLVINLVKNAIVHSGGDRVLVKLALKPGTTLVKLELSVVDNGRGLIELEAETLFEPFVRGQTQAEGTGLGLYICRELARAMRAELSHRPADFGGSCFTLLGEFEAHEANQTALNKDPISLSGHRVLIVEDNLTLQMLTRAILEKAGAKVSVAGDGKEGIERLRSDSFDLVLSDIFMPNVDGFAFVRAARELGFSGPIIGVTAATIGEEIPKMLEAGADRVLPKPLSLRRLLDVIGELD